MSYHAPRPVRLSFVYATAHEKVPKAKKSNDGVLTATSRSPDNVYDSALSCAAPCSPTHRPRHGTREGTGDEEGRRRRTTATPRSTDDVYGALSCAAYRLRISFCCQV